MSRSLMALAFQGAVYDLVSTDAGCVAIQADRIYDQVPEQAAHPYSSFGPDDVTNADADCLDGADVFLQVDVWSREPGHVENKRLCGAIESAVIGKTVTRDGFEITIEHNTTRHFRDPDGMTAHGVISLRAEIYSATA